MRLNKYIALATGISRRAADAAIQDGRVTINGRPAALGDMPHDTDAVQLDGIRLELPTTLQTIMINKPAGYVVSRDGQGSPAIYDIVPGELHGLKPVGRLDKDSSGLLLLTNDGALANELTHPSRHKVKIYEITLDAALQPLHRQMISDFGITLDDGPSRLELERIRDGDEAAWRVTMHEGRNRQIRRTFAALGYTVTSLHRTHFGPYTLGRLKPGTFTEVA